MSTTPKRQHRSKGEGGIYLETIYDRSACTHDDGVACATSLGCVVRREYWVGQADLSERDARGRRVPGTPRARKKVTGKTRTEVAKKLTALRREHEAEQLAGAEGRQRSWTIAEAVSVWKSHGYPGPKGRKEKSTIAHLDQRLAANLLPALGSTPIAALKVEQVEAWWQSMADAGARKATIEKHRGDLVQLINWANRRTQSSWNAAKIAHLPAAAEPREQFVHTRAEREILFEALSGNRLEAFFILLAEMGLRPGEAEGMRWIDIVENWETGVPFDWSDDTQRPAWLLVRTAVKRGESGKAIELGEPKTPRVGALQLGPRSVAALRRHRAVQAAEKLRAGAGWYANEPEWNDCVFLTELGAPLNASNVRRALTLVCEKAKVTRVTPYQLRHTALTILRETMPLDRVMWIAGHKDTRMLERTYLHAPKAISIVFDAPLVAPSATQEGIHTMTTTTCPICSIEHPDLTDEEHAHLLRMPKWTGAEVMQFVTTVHTDSGFLPSPVTRVYRELGDWAVLHFGEPVGDDYSERHVVLDFAWALGALCGAADGVAP